MTGLLALAFGAGLLAPVNPCGFGLLPAMLTATVGPVSPGAETLGLVSRLAGGLRAGLAMTLGFTAVFTIIGVGLTLGVRSLITVVPWLAAGLGVVLVLVGVALLAGWHFPLRLPTRHPEIPGQADSRPGTARIVVFGAGYAVASASCTLAVLLAVVSQAAATTPAGVLAVFTSYAVGSATLLISLALIAAAAGNVLAQYMQRFARYAARIAGLMLALSGAYLLVYWLPQLLGSPRPGYTGVARLAGGVATWVAEHELAVVLTGAVLIVSTVGALGVTRRRSGQSSSSTAANGLGHME